MHDQLPITYEEMRGLVVEALASTPDSQSGSLEVAVAKLGSKQGHLQAAQRLPGLHSTNTHGSPSEDHLSRKDLARLQSIQWDLIIEGVIRPGLNDGINNQLPHYHVTEFGKEKLKCGPTSPYDPDGYIKRLKGAVPALDPVILTYLNESLLTFRIGCSLSSTIALGCASEKALLLLIGAYADALSAARQTKFRQNTENKVIKRQFDEFTKMLDSHLKALLPGEITEDLDVALSAIFAMLRTHRNEAGHPTGKMPDREQCHASITVFPTYVRKVYGLIDWLKVNSPLT
jgi:hypothetical protein